MANFGTALPCFVATNKFTNIRKVPTAHLTMMTIVAMNRYLVSEEGREEFKGHTDPYQRGGLLTQWSLFGVQQVCVCVCCRVHPQT